MARAAVKAKQQAASKAQKAQPAKAMKRPRGRRRHSSGGNPNQQLFFMRLRRHAKWAYVLLALLFAITFAALGVGSGNNSGLDQIFSGLDIFGGGGGTSVSKAQKEVAKHPNSAKALRDLATAYEQKGDTGGAVTALQQYLDVKKKDADAWSELGGLQLQQGQTWAARYQEAAAAQQLAAPSQPFRPSGTLGTALGTNPIEQALAGEASGTTNDYYERATLGYANAVQSYQEVAKLRPRDANAQFLVASAAQDAGQYDVAVDALRKYLKLNPNTTQRGQIENLIKQLSPALKTPAKKPAKKSGASK
ncbi:MAG TPA: tetratricopeptide repeat protein [Gaiellaceae bacterium]|nr:tetratricopeptide repeat protein [Gaiellaceae bacterium]